MEDFWGSLSLGWVLGGLTVVVFLLATDSTHQDGVRKGQIQCLTGDVQYHLVMQPDSTRTWERIR